ncbi:MAG: hypothetical protein EOO01_41000, partial [Chitinophagaceae bacterium]
MPAFANTFPLCATISSLFMLRVILGTLLFAGCSCTENERNYSVSERRDSLVTHYIKLVDSLNSFDSLDSRTRMLLAYMANDTAYMKAVNYDLEEAFDESREHFQARRKIQPPDITTYNFDEAYRFQYSAAFCDQSVDITIGSKNDSVLLSGYR